MRNLLLLESLFSPPQTSVISTNTTTLITSAVFANFQFLQILQSHIQDTTTATTANFTTLSSKLIDNKKTKFMKFDKCFNCKQESHIFSNCI